jgi:predicted RNA-binding protein YlxR (DUF448 family)
LAKEQKKKKKKFNRSLKQNTSPKSTKRVIENLRGKITCNLTSKTITNSTKQVVQGDGEIF